MNAEEKHFDREFGGVACNTRARAKNIEKHDPQLQAGCRRHGTQEYKYTRCITHTARAVLPPCFQYGPNLRLGFHPRVICLPARGCSQSCDSSSTLRLSMSLGGGREADLFDLRLGAGRQAEMLCQRISACLFAWLGGCDVVCTGVPWASLGVPGLGVPQLYRGCCVAADHAFWRRSSRSDTCCSCSICSRAASGRASDWRIESIAAIVIRIDGATASALCTKGDAAPRRAGGSRSRLQPLFPLPLEEHAGAFFLGAFRL